MKSVKELGYVKNVKLADSKVFIYFQNGQVLRTSDVKNIGLGFSVEENQFYAFFETQNSVYKVSLTSEQLGELSQAVQDVYQNAKAV